MGGYETSQNVNRQQKDFDLSQNNHMIYKNEQKVIETMGLDRQKVKVKRGSQAHTPGDRR